MLPASVKEYELLKKEVQNVKDCITKYIGFLIGSNGAIYLIYTAFHSIFQKNITLFNIDLASTQLLIILEILIITSIYYIINYKFGSHNRYIGYLQLLSHEIHHVQMDENDKSIKNYNLDNGYEFNFEEEINYPPNIFSWDYVQSKWKSRIKSNEYPEDYFNSLDLRLHLPDSYDSFGRCFDNKNVIQMFFQYIVWEIYSLSYKPFKFYRKLRIKSWRYPFHIFLLSLTLIIVSFTLLFAESKDNLEVGYYFLGFMLIPWFYYSISLFRLLKRNKTIDYYCWAFLPYRVKLLNTYNIRPIYQSTSFQRYFKSIKIYDHKPNIDTTIWNKLKMGLRLTNNEKSKLGYQIRD